MTHSEHAPSNPAVALLTDFGLADSYVGTMKAVMHSLCPQIRFIDITHAIQPQNIRQAAFTLLVCCRYFAPGTVFLAVVDPGVGSARRPIAARAGDYFFVGPDNGVFAYALAGWPDLAVVELAAPAYRLNTVSSTFHGRDIFAPAAAHLACGLPLEMLGPPATGYYPLSPPALTVSETVLAGEIIHIDHFGSAVTSIGELQWASADALRLTPRFAPAGHPPAERETISLPANAVITINAHSIHAIRRTYSDVPPGEALALVGSSGFLEIAVNQGSAANQLGIKTGMPVTVTFRG